MTIKELAIILKESFDSGSDIDQSLDYLKVKYGLFPDTDAYIPEEVTEELEKLREDLRELEDLRDDNIQLREDKRDLHNKIEELDETIEDLVSTVESLESKLDFFKEYGYL